MINLSEYAPIHVYPLNDLREHNIDGTACHCRPTHKWDDPLGEVIIIHNSYDLRELHEDMGYFCFNSRDFLVEPNWN